MSLLLVTVGSTWALVHRYESQVTHRDLLGGAVSDQQQQHFASGPLNLLLLGSDSRQGEKNDEGVTGQRSDTIMLVHIAARRDRASIISIPRDSFVNVPAGGNWPGGPNKINAALAFGGAPLAARTVAQLIGVPLDGAMIADFSGVRTMVDALGGVRVCLDETVRSGAPSRVWTPGCHQMDGAEAEEFMRERKNVPGGDFGRIRDQQLVVSSIMQKTFSDGLLTNPVQLDRVLMTAAQALTIDNSLNLRQLASAVRGIDPSAVRFATVPYRNADMRTFAGSSVELDPARSQAMFAAIRDDTIDAWIAANPSG